MLSASFCCHVHSSCEPLIKTWYYLPLWTRKHSDGHLSISLSSTPHNHNHTVLLNVDLPRWFPMTIMWSLYFGLWQRGLPVRSRRHRCGQEANSWANSVISSSWLLLAISWVNLASCPSSPMLVRLLPETFSTCSEAFKESNCSHIRL